MKNPNLRPAIIAGITAAFLLILWLGFGEKPAVVLLAGPGSILILGVGIISTLWTASRKPATELFTFGKAFGISMRITLFTAAVMGICTFIYGEFINPGFLDELIKNSEAYFRKEGKSEKEIMENSQMLRATFSPLREIMKAMFGTLLFGLVIGLMFSALFGKPAKQ